MKKMLQCWFIAAGLLVSIGSATGQPLLWQPKMGPYGGVVWAMVASPVNGRVWSGNGFYSSDNGASWLAKANGLLPGSAQSHFTMAINDDGDLFCGNFGGSYRSTDGGDNWLPMFLPGSPSVISLATHGSDVLAGSYGGKIYFSSDKGSNWSVLHDSSDFTTDVMALVSFGQTIYAGTYGEGVRTSNDGGKTWANIEEGGSLPAGIESLISTDGTPSSLLAGTNKGIYYTASGGTSWNIRIDVGADVFALATNPLTGIVYAATNLGIYRSAGPLGSWAASNTGLTTLQTRSLAIDKNTGNIYTGTNSDGVFRSTNNGDTWEQVGTPVAVFSLTAYQGRNILAATNDSLFTTRDAGASWQQANSGIPHQVSNVVYTDPSDGKIYAGTYVGIYRSDDNTASWVRADNGITNHTFYGILSTRTNDVFAATAGGLFESTDQGASWAFLGNGLQDTVVWDSAVYAITYDTAGYLYAAKSSGIYRSNNGGANWQLVNATLPGNVASLCVTANGDVFAGMSAFGILKSTDKGETWSESNTSITFSVNQMIVAPNGTIFAATSGDGAYYSLNNGATWSYSNSGLASLTIYTLALDNVGYLWAGTLDGGVYRSATTFSGVKPADASKSALCVYPNPVTDKVFIEADESGILEVFDALGNTLVAQEAHVGTNEVPMNSIPGGAYLLRLATRSRTSVSNIVVIR